MPRILVTGAAGFIGYHLAKYLADDAANQVFAVDNFARGEADGAYETLIARENVTGLTVDLAEQSEVLALPGEVDVVYHMAAINGTQNFYDRPFEVMRCCTLPTFYLLNRYSKRGAATKFIYAGTSESYASTVTRFGWEVPTGENVPLSIADVFNPRWSYAASKLHGEVLTVNAARQFGLRYVIVRYHNAYGPRMGDKHVIPDFCKRMNEGVYRLHGHAQTRSFIYIDDAVRATVMLAHAKAAEGEVVNVGGAKEVTMLQVAQAIMKVAKVKGEIEKLPAPAGCVDRRAPKLDKLRKLTDYQQHWSLEDGLGETLRFYCPQLSANPPKKIDPQIRTDETWGGLRQDATWPIRQEKETSTKTVKDNGSR